MSKNKDELIVRIDERLQSFIEQHEKDKAEAKERIAAENTEKNQWRGEIMDKFNGLEKKMNPIIKDHELIVKGGKWVIASAAAGLATVKGWVFLKDHLK